MLVSFTSPAYESVFHCDQLVEGYGAWKQSPKGGFEIDETKKYYEIECEDVHDITYYDPKENTTYRLEDVRFIEDEWSGCHWYEAELWYEV